MSQVHPLRDLTKKNGLTPRLIVVALHTSGTSRFENRPDFEIVREGIELGWCKWVAWRGPDRIAREVLPAELLYDLLRTNGIDLFLTSLNRAVDWDRDHIYLRSLGLASATEAASIKARTQGAIRARYPDMRRGWPGQRKFGFRRNLYTKFLEVDPEQWEFVKRIHFGYADATSAQTNGLKAVAANVSALGCDLSYSQVRRCLMDRIYVDGRFFSTVDGEEIEQHPIALDDPIPEEVFQRNQELLKLRESRRTTTQVGEYCLNSIPVIHEACCDLRNDKGYAAHLRGRTISGVRAYRHSPWIPTDCRGFSIPQETLETAVIETVRSKLASDALNAAFAESCRKAQRGFDTQILTPENKRHIRRQVRERTQLKAQLTRRYLDSLGSSCAPSPQAYWDLVGALSAEIDHLERRLQSREPTPTVSELPDTRDLLEKLHLFVPVATPLVAERRILRAALLNALISEIRVSVEGRNLDVTVTLKLPS